MKQSALYLATLLCATTPALVCAAPSYHPSQLQQAAAIYNLNDPTAARGQLLALADAGNPFAAMMVQRAYEKAAHNFTIDVAAAQRYAARYDRSKMLSLLQQWADQGQADALNWMGNHYRDQSMPREQAKALRYFKRNAEAGNSYAQMVLGHLYHEGRGIPKDDNKAVYWYTKSAEAGNSNAMTSLGVMYRDGKGVPQDDTKAVQWYTNAAEAGDATGMTNLGWMYQEGRGVPQDNSKAVYWYNKSAEAGNSNAMTSLGVMYRDGKGVPQDDTKAVQWYTNAAEAGDATGMTNLGWMYQEGRGVPKDDSKAVYWYNKAAEGGDTSGMNRLGLMYENGRGVPQDNSKAVHWYNKAAEAGNFYAMLLLGISYARGQHGVQKDENLALIWFDKAAKLSNTLTANIGSAMVNIGKDYALGRGVKQDDEKALFWYLKAAQNNNAEALFLLGYAHLMGRGTAKNPDKALEWFIKATESNLSYSRYNLGVMFSEGTGFEQNFNQAAVWYLKASQTVHPVNLSPLVIPESQRAKERLADLLAGNQITDTDILRQIQSVLKPAPRLTWSNQPLSNTNAETVELVVRLQDTGSGIGNVRLLVNGIAVDQSSRALGRTQQGQAASTAANSTEQRFSLKLPKGSHQIRIEAFNAENLGVPATLDTTIVSNYQAVRQPKLHALVIGIDQYKNSTLQLNYAVSDANTIYQRLQQQVGGLYQAGQITRLTTPAQTTKANIIAELTKLQQQAHLEDVFVLYVASHGVSYDDAGYFMLTSDVLQTSQDRIIQHSLSSEELQNLIVKIGTNKKLVILDTCNSGRALNAERLLVSRGMQDQTMVERMRRKAGATVLMASETAEQAREGYQGHGLFTYSVLQALTKGDVDKDGYVDSSELIKYVEDQVPALAEQRFKTTQTPFTSFAGQSVVLKAQ